MVQYNVVVVYAFSIHFNRFYRAILVENSEISNDYKIVILSNVILIPLSPFKTYYLENKLKKYR